MKKLLLIVLLAVFSLTLMPACNQEKKSQEAIVNIAKEVNAQGNDTLSKGSIFQGSTYKPGDPVFTFNIKVVDKNFINTPNDSLKARIRVNLVNSIKVNSENQIKEDPERKQAEFLAKLVRVLAQNSVGLQYAYTLPQDTTVRVVFPPAEVKLISQIK